MRSWKEVLADVDEAMPNASDARRIVELFREWLGLPEGFSFDEAETRVRSLLRLGAEGEYWGLPIEGVPPTLASDLLGE